MHELRRTAGRAGGEVALLDKADGEPAGRRIEGAADAGDTAADDQHVEFALGHAFEVAPALLGVEGTGFGGHLHASVCSGPEQGDVNAEFRQYLGRGRRRRARRGRCCARPRLHSWREFEDRSARVAAAIDAAGIGHDDKVGLYLYNGFEYEEAQFALQAARVPCNVNYRYLADELAYLLTNADAKALFFDVTLADRVAEVRDRCPDLQLMIQVGAANCSTALSTTTISLRATSRHPESSGPVMTSGSCTPAARPAIPKPSCGPTPSSRRALRRSIAHSDSRFPPRSRPPSPLPSNSTSATAPRGYSLAHR